MRRRRVHPLRLHGLTPAQKLILTVLHLSGGPLTAKELHDATGIPYPLGRRQIDRPLEFLIASGMVECTFLTRPHSRGVVRYRVFTLGAKALLPRRARATAEVIRRSA